MTGFVGGWPGALVAQQLFRHKTRKRSFRRAFWITVVVNVLVLAAFIGLLQAGLRMPTSTTRGCSSIRAPPGCMLADRPVDRAVPRGIRVAGVVDGDRPSASLITAVTMPVWSRSPESSQSNCTTSPIFTWSRWSSVSAVARSGCSSRYPSSAVELIQASDEA